jgi:hypothetical protein
MTNGFKHTGTIDVGDLDLWSFSANAGDSVVLRMGATGFNPHIRLFGPDGKLVASAFIPNVGGIDTEIPATTLTNGGIYTVVVNSYYQNPSGAYILTLAQSPGSFVVSPGDQGGSMTNGFKHSGTIDVGDLDLWSFSANAGDSVVLRMGATGFNPHIRLFGPDGKLVASAFIPNVGGIDAEIPATTLTNAGIYTVVVNSYYSNPTGTYILTLAKSPGTFVVAPGDEGGPMSNGAKQTGTIDVGDLDLWSFSANAGDSVVLRMGATGFNPHIRLFGPDGKLVASAFIPNVGGRDAEIPPTTLTNGGIYTVVANSYYQNAFGTYNLTLVQVPGAFVVSPGDDGGTLTNGFQHGGSIEVGDLDLWQFSANAGDALLLRMGTIGFNPQIRLYGPNGAQIGQAFHASVGGLDAELSIQVTNTGTFTVVAGGYYANGTGTYILTLARPNDVVAVAPSDEGGSLTNGAATAGTMSMGDLEVWGFTANAGDLLTLRMGGTNFNPRIYLYGPDGKLIGSAGAANIGRVDATLTLSATNTGMFTVVGAAFGLNQSGTYAMHLARIPAAFEVSSGDQGGPMANGFIHSATNSLGDLDLWGFYGTVGDSNWVWLIASNYTADVRLFGPAGTLLRSFTTTGSNHFTYVVTNEGAHTILVQSSALNGLGTYRIRQSRVPPDLNVPPTQNLVEGDTLNVTISAQDPDVPDRPLTFAPVSLPPGALLSVGGATNAGIAWATDESIGPSTNLFVVSVTDVVNGTAFTRTNSFTVVVNESNRPPVLTVPGTIIVNEQTPLVNVSVSATDPDLPTNVLKFSLLSAPPTGLTLDENSGAFSWTPSEAQGSNSHTITVVVTDTNPPAINAKQLSATNSFTIIVREINVAPQFTGPNGATIDERTAANVDASATDSDLPPNGLSYQLFGQPSGMTISASTGMITWTPDEAQGPGVYPVSVVATDNNPTAFNTQQLSTTNLFTVTVREVNSPPLLTVPTNQTLDELTPLNVVVSSTDGDLPVNPRFYSLVDPPTGMTINTNTGAIVWTSSETQGPSTNNITVVVTDTNANATVNSQLSATNSFTVTVREVNNHAPVLGSLTNHTVNAGQTVNFTASATDNDTPSNLTFELLSSPAGASITSNGLFTWRPPVALANTTNAIQVRVNDNGSPGSNDVRSFSVTVNPLAPVNLLLIPQTNSLFRFAVSGPLGPDYVVSSSSNLTQWSDLATNLAPTPPFIFLDVSSGSASNRAYRVRLGP